MVLFHYVISLVRGGRSNHPIYHIVSTLSYRSRNSMFLFKLGFLDLTRKQHIFFLNLRGLGSSLNKGATLNYSVKHYISKFCI